MKQAAHTARVKAMEEEASPKAADGKGAAAEYGALAAEKAAPAAATEEPAAAAALEEPAAADGSEAEEAERTMAALKKEIKQSVSNRAANMVSE